jgi:hypothetical protein
MVLFFFKAKIRGGPGSGRSSGTGGVPEQEASPLSTGFFGAGGRLMSLLALNADMAYAHATDPRA